MPRFPAQALLGAPLLTLGSTEAHPVIARDNPTLGIEINLQPVGDHG